MTPPISQQRLQNDISTNADFGSLEDQDGYGRTALTATEANRRARGGMRDRLVENGFDEEYNAIVVHLGGQPARATRRLTKRFHDELGLPVVVFTDGDPWSYRIYGSVAYGSIKSAHLSEYLATPEAKFIGIQPADIVEYDLPTDPLSDSDKNALESELEDPRFQTDYWEEQIELQLEIEKKSEQQSLASHGLDFVTDTYLPERLDEMGII